MNQNADRYSRPTFWTSKVVLLCTTFVLVLASEFGAAFCIVSGSSYSEYVNLDFAKRQIGEAVIVAGIATALYSGYVLQIRQAGLVQYVFAIVISIVVFLIAAYFYVALVGV